MKKNIHWSKIMKKTCACFGCVLLISGCVTAPSPEKLCPRPDEFTESANERWLSFKAHKVVADGQVKAIVYEDSWHSKKYATYTFPLPAGVRAVGLRRDGYMFWVSYFMPDNTRILEEWMQTDGTGGGALIPFIIPPNYMLNQKWQQQTGGVWVSKSHEISSFKNRVIIQPDSH